MFEQLRCLTMSESVLQLKVTQAVKLCVSENRSVFDSLEVLDP